MKVGDASWLTRRKSAGFALQFIPSRRLLDVEDASAPCFGYTHDGEFFNDSLSVSVIFVFDFAKLVDSTTARTRICISTSR